MRNPGIRNIGLLFALFINVSLNYGQRFAVVSDIHGAFPATQSVSNMVRGWNPDFIITCGDNNYAALNAIDSQVGQFYHDFISPYNGGFGAGDTVNRFFSSLGNHDEDSGGINSYVPYMNLPGNERYYDFVKGYVHFFCINSNADEPDGVSDTSIQAQWLQNQLASSTSLYNLVYFHHSPYSSGLGHGSNAYMQWPFKQWGASTVFSGHDHIYERLLIGNLPYFVCGTGGGTLYAATPISGSQFIYNASHGALLLEAYSNTLLLKFINTNDSLVDLYYINPHFASSVENQEYTRDLTVNVYPNPAKESIVVSFLNHKQAFTISISDIFGRCVYNKDYFNNNCNFEVAQQRIGVDALSRGSYFVTISCRGYVVTRKIVII
jgi:tartrate-resistant acid phosphatase type 5